mmetsp:Transcript_58430/g.117024  ORF Transcript_58430/g.117024 Transcript_58430/m.117024 type:complete len:245 (-) Transcript_58430:18-752(-)
MSVLLVEIENPDSYTGALSYGVGEAIGKPGVVQNPDDRTAAPRYRDLNKGSVPDHEAFDYTITPLVSWNFLERWLFQVFALAPGTVFTVEGSLQAPGAEGHPNFAVIPQVQHPPLDHRALLQPLHGEAVLYLMIRDERRSRGPDVDEDAEGHEPRDGTLDLLPHLQLGCRRPCGRMCVSTVTRAAWAARAGHPCSPTSSPKAERHKVEIEGRECEDDESREQTPRHHGLWNRGVAHFNKPSVEP